MSEELKSAAKKLFDEGRIDLLIGYGKGTLPLRTTPCFVTKPEQVDDLVWDEFCSNNLAVFLPRLFSRTSRPKGWKPPRVGIVAKGCDGRSIVGLLKEKQVPRENIVILGVPCTGMVDLTKLPAALNGSQPVGAEVSEDGTLTVHTKGGRDVKLKMTDVLCEPCRSCPHPESPVCDIQVGSNAAEAKPLSLERVAAFEAKSVEERWDHFTREISKCIRCYACRQACPNCYCTTCFAEQTQPKWLGVGVDLSDVMVYHLGRIFHQAGRCVDCGACVRACPMGIDLALFTRKMIKDVQELFGYEAGVSLDEPPALVTFEMDDDQSFITEP